jgi:dipeptidyl aminopeptidase/acylaminoacyl peptidase
MIEALRRPLVPVTDSANFAVADNGTLVMLPPDPLAEGGRVQTILTWVDRDGRETPLSARPDDYTLARISPDGSKIALVISSGLRRIMRPAIWIFDQRTETLRLLTADEAGDDTPLWSSDGQRIFFRSFRGGRTSGGVYAIDVETGETTPVGVSAEYPYSMPWAITPGDGELLLINGETIDNFNITKLAVADAVFSPLLHEPVSESEPSLSPNGAWMAYAVGRVPSQIDIVPYPGVSRTRIPVGPGQSPVFSRDGSEIFYYDGSGLSAVPISYEPTLRVGTPRRLFESAGYQWAVDGRAWDFDPSGQRFLMIRERPNAADDTREGERIDVVLNWFEELNSRVPVQ